jgi:antibiotic biosynthesis monooxygenase (ABM) superfamily enzyme
MSMNQTAPHAPTRVTPPSKHQLALTIWLCVFPTLLVLNLSIGEHLKSLPTVLRTLIQVTIAVPIVTYGLMPQLHKARARLLTRRTR